MQCCNSDGTIGHTSGKGLTSLPIPRLPHPDVSAEVSGVLLSVLKMGKGFCQQTLYGTWLWLSMYT